MIAFLFSMVSLLNLLFYVFGIGFVISLIIEQFVKENERNLLIVQTNRRYCWRQAWVVNINWFACNIGLYFLSRNMASPVDTFWNGM